MFDFDTERLLAEIEAFAHPDDGKRIIAQFQLYLERKAWHQLAGEPLKLMRDGVIIQLPPQIKTRADLLQIARVIEIVAKFETRYRSDTWRDVISVSVKMVPVINPWVNS